MNILINGQIKTIDQPRVNYYDLVKLAEIAPGEDYAAKFHKRGESSGILSPGNSVEVKQGMVFTVIPKDI